MSEHKQPHESLDDIVSVLRARQRRIQTCVLAARGLFYGSLGGLTVAVVGAAMRATWIRPVPWPALAVTAALALLAAMIGLLRRLDALQLAHALDRAAASEDRFASALQLAGHHRQARVRMVAEDALAHVGETHPRAALPWKAPPELKWLPLPVAALVLVCWLAPGPRLYATEPAPEISSDEWAAIQQEFSKHLDELDHPETPEEKEMRRRIEQLVSSLEKNPAKKDVLAQIARLQSELKQRQLSLGTRDVSMRKVANVLRGEKPLDRMKSLLREGQYSKAAEEMRALAEQMSADKLSMTAAEFEAASKDFERMAAELASHEELSQACRDCANAASSMNRERLSESLRRFSRTLDKNVDDLRQCDSCRSSNRLLDELRRRLSGSKPCGGCNKPGCASCNAFVRRSDKKGGSKAGWGTAAKWDGGTLGKREVQRLPDLVDVREGQGADTALTTISPEERAVSERSAKEVYAEMVRKAEADLDLEEVPLAYRDYLRRYFSAISPKEESNPPESEE